MHRMKWLFTLLLASFINRGEAQGLYATQVSQACKEMIDGGCIITTTCLLLFDCDSVRVTYQYKADCTSKEKESAYEQLNGRPGKAYSWKQKDHTIIIDGFTDYGPLAMQGQTLVGNILRNKMEPLVFQVVSDKL